MRPTPFRLSQSRRATRGLLLITAITVTAIALAGCTAPHSQAPGSPYANWSGVLKAAHGETVNLWMYSGDQQGDAYVDNVLTPAVAKYGVTLRRVPIADTADAVNRTLSELQAGHKSGGSVDLVWLNGENFRTGKQAGAWLCHWTALLPNMAHTSKTDPLLTTDFGTPVDGCEAPWSKAQFTIVYNSAAVKNPPTTIAGVLAWAKAHPGRFTYPAPPDFTGSAFIREVLYSVSGGYAHVPAVYSNSAFTKLSPKLYSTLSTLAPSLWDKGSTYPASSDQLNKLYANRQIDMTMTYGPATLTKLVANGTYPPETKVLTMTEGTIGNASFLGIPSNAAHTAGAMVVANVALSVQQQFAKAEPATWGQFTVLNLPSLTEAQKTLFANLPASAVVPPFAVLSRNANPELEAAWVPALDDGWRTHVAAGR